MNKMIKPLLISVIFIFISHFSFGQDDEDVIYPTVYKERSLNLTGLLNQFIPFGNLSSKVGPITYAETKIKGEKIRRFGIGINVEWGWKRTADQ